MFAQQTQQQHGGFVRLRLAVFVLAKSGNTAAKQLARFSLSEFEFFARQTQLCGIALVCTRKRLAHSRANVRGVITCAELNIAAYRTMPASDVCNPIRFAPDVPLYGSAAKLQHGAIIALQTVPGEILRVMSFLLELNHHRAIGAQGEFDILKMPQIRFCNLLIILQ